MPRVDSRVVTMPLLIGGAVALVAGLVGALVAATTTIAVAHPLVMAGIGLVCLVIAAAVTLVRAKAERDASFETTRIPAEPRTRRQAIVGGALGVALVALVLLATLGPGASLANFVLGNDDATAAPLGQADLDAPDAPLAVEEFTGTLQGLALPVLGGAGTSSVTHDLAAPSDAGTTRLELDWTAGPGGAAALALRLEAQVGDAWEEVAVAQGAPRLVLDATTLPLDATAFRAVVAIPEGAGTPSQAYELYVSWFEGEVPADYAHAPSE